MGAFNCVQQSVPTFEGLSGCPDTDLLGARREDTEDGDESILHLEHIWAPIFVLLQPANCASSRRARLVIELCCELTEVARIGSRRAVVEPDLFVHLAKRRITSL